MNREDQPIERLAQLAEGKVSGELICASDSVEVHVYFQCGRIAWATDSTQPLAFTRQLLSTAQIDLEIFREILESCRREKRPLGETLIAWGVATQAEVREALRHQINLAVTRLQDSGPMQTLFLSRASQFAGYDAQLTFAVDDILGAPPSGRPLAAPSGRPPPRAPREPTGVPSLVTRLRSAIESVAWVELLDGTTPIESLPEATTASRIPAPLVQGTTLDGAELVALRMATMTLAGIALSPSRSLWCLVTAGVTVGEIVATLATFAPASSSGRDLPRTGPRWSFGMENEGVTAALQSFVDHASEVQATFITDPAMPAATYGVGRTEASAEAVAAIVNRRAQALVLADLLDEAPAARPDADGQFSRRTMTMERDFCLFTVDCVVEGRRRILWLLLDRTSSKGLGWGYLTALSRDLARVVRPKQRDFAVKTSLEISMDDRADSSLAPSTAVD